MEMAAIQPLMHRVSLEHCNGVEPVDVADLADLKAELKKRGALDCLLKLLSHQDTVHYQADHWTPVDDLPQADFDWLALKEKAVFKSVCYRVAGD